MIRVARPGTRVVIADETERFWDKQGRFSRIGSRLCYGRRLAQEISSFRCEDMLKLVPENSLNVRFDYIREGNGYRLEFTKP